MGLKSIFVDTNYFCGLYNSADTLHLKSKEIFEKFKKTQHKLYTSSFIVAEVLTVLSQRIGKKSSIDFGTDILSQENLIKILRINTKIERDAFVIFKKIKSKNFSFVDALSLALIKKHKINLLLTFDKQLVNLAKTNNIKILS
ncbi:PIN domain-containing protein [Patescibacteria group bacterium]|nr:PIN domain-containing protein [Patescibacteria group bacterium]MBU1931657.1 PIN domain-containing protein [Patescibacteria group bacterium]